MSKPKGHKKSCKCPVCKRIRAKTKKKGGSKSKTKTKTKKKGGKKTKKKGGTKKRSRPWVFK